MATKKLIEVALPLDKINEASAREKSIRHGHPSTLHLWWARRPLAAARAVIWSSLVDDPSSHPELFPTEEDQNRERQRLFKILEDLVIWENSNNQDVLNAAKDEILKCSNDCLPPLLDPFAGGGAIPLEAQRLGLKSYANDLNPIAVMINRAILDYPSRFWNKSPVNPDVIRIDGQGWSRAEGLVEDVKFYGEWVKNHAYSEIGALYPNVKLSNIQGGNEATVIAWLWARTVKCPNPACGCTMPLASKFAVSKKKNKETWVEPIFKDGKFSFVIHKGKCPKEKETLKMGRGAIFKCPVCGEITLDSYVKEEGKAGRIGAQLMAIVAEGPRGRVYVPPTIDHEIAANVERPKDVLSGMMPNNPRWFSPPAFGMNSYELCRFAVTDKVVKNIEFVNCVFKVSKEGNYIVFNLSDNEATLEMERFVFKNNLVYHTTGSSYRVNVLTMPAYSSGSYALAADFSNNLFINVPSQSAYTAVLTDVSSFTFDNNIFFEGNGYGSNCYLFDIKNTSSTVSSVYVSGNVVIGLSSSKKWFYSSDGVVEEISSVKTAIGGTNEIAKSEASSVFSSTPTVEGGEVSYTLLPAYSSVGPLAL